MKLNQRLASWERESATSRVRAQVQGGLPGCSAQPPHQAPPPYPLLNVQGMPPVGRLIYLALPPVTYPEVRQSCGCATGPFHAEMYFDRCNVLIQLKSSTPRPCPHSSSLSLHHLPLRAGLPGFAEACLQHWGARPQCLPQKLVQGHHGEAVSLMTRADRDPRGKGGLETKKRLASKARTTCPPGLNEQGLLARLHPLRPNFSTRLGGLLAVNAGSGSTCPRARSWLTTSARSSPRSTSTGSITSECGSGERVTGGSGWTRRRAE